MYKTIEIKNVIGYVCMESCGVSEMYMRDVREVMKQVNEEDDFITTVFSRKAISHVADILGMEIDDMTNLLPSSRSKRSDFIREYYRVDADTRSVMADVIKKHFKR